MQLKGKEKMIGAIVAVIVAVAGALGALNADELKEGFCSNEMPAPAPVQAPVVEKK